MSFSSEIASMDQLQLQVSPDIINLAHVALNLFRRRLIYVGVQNNGNIVK